MTGVETEIIHAAVTVSIDSIERMTGRGSLRALVHCTITIGDVEIKVSGCQVVRTAEGWQVRTPTYRGVSGVSKPSLELPGVVWDQILELLCEILTDDNDPRTGIR